MPNPFARQVIACTGSFGDQATEADIRRWVEVNGGRFSPEIKRSVNYLICSEEAWKNRDRDAKVKAVLKSNKERKKDPEKGKQIHIVHFDWLEDATRFGRLMPAKKYCLKTIISQKNQKKKEATQKRGELVEMKKTRRQIDEEAECFTLCRHRVYEDADGFEYEITLTRPFEFEELPNARKKPRKIKEEDTDDREELKIAEPTGPTMGREIYHVRLWQSVAVPHLYACGLSYSKPGHKKIHQVLAPMGSWFWDAFSKFREFFEAKTMKRWDQRLDGRGRARDKYEYVLPVFGRPVGQLPQGIVDYRSLEREESPEPAEAHVEVDEGYGTSDNKAKTAPDQRERS